MHLDRPTPQEIQRTDLPRTLIIGQPFNNDTGGGITLSNLYAGWPASKLAVACSAYELENNIDIDRCTNYYQLGSEEDQWMFPLSLIKRKYQSGTISFKREEKFRKSVHVKKRFRQRLISGLMQPALEFAGLQDYLSNKILSSRFCRWIDDFDPEIIYVQASSLPDVKFSIAVHDYLGKPMVFHMMDDWPSLIKHDGAFKTHRYNVLDKWLRNLIGRCSLLLSISDAMSEAYRERYDKNFIPFHNPIDLQFWKQHERTDYALSPSPEVLYAGRTGLGIDSSLIAAAKALALTNQSLGLTAKLILQTSIRPSWIDEYDCVDYRKFVPYDELPRLFAKADLLLLPYDFSSKSIKYIKLSMPTKATEFMTCGTPIVVFAPLETAVAKYAREHKWAKVVGENDVDQLASAFKQMLSSRQDRFFLGTNARKLASARHDANIVARTFQDLIGGAVRKNKVDAGSHRILVKKVY